LWRAFSFAAGVLCVGAHLKGETKLRLLITSVLAISLAGASRADIKVSPSIAKSGDSVHITGGPFSGATSVAFMGASAVFQVDSADAITAIVPPAATTGAIVVTTPSGPLTSAQPFEVVAHQWDAVQDFSLGSNPSGAWTYGVEPSLGGAFSPLTVEEQACATGIACWQNTLAFPNSAEVARNTTPYSLHSQSLVIPTDVLWLGAQDNAVVARWIAPATGNYTITGSFSAVDLDTRNAVSIDIAILQGGSTSLFSGSFSSFGVEKPFRLNNLALTAGTTIDFVAAYTASPDSDNAGLVARISQLK